MKKLAKWLAIVVAFFLLLWLIIAIEGCNTIEGFRRDVHQVTRPATETGQ